MRLDVVVALSVILAHACARRYAITNAQFRCFVPASHPSDALIATFVPRLNDAMERHFINRSHKRVVAFLAETYRESAGFTTFVEYSDTLCVTRGYCGGCPYKGRGVLQITHKCVGEERGTRGVHETRGRHEGGALVMMTPYLI